MLTKHYLQVLVAFPDLLMDVAGLSNPSGKGRVRMTSEPLEPMGARMDRIERHIAALAKRAGVVLIA